MLLQATPLSSSIHSESNRSRMQGIGPQNPEPLNVTPNGGGIGSIASNPVINLSLLFSSLLSSFSFFFFFSFERERENTREHGARFIMPAYNVARRPGHVTGPTSGRSLGSAWRHFLPLPPSLAVLHVAPFFHGCNRWRGSRVRSTRDPLFFFRRFRPMIVTTWSIGGRGTGEPKLASGRGGKPDETGGWKKGIQFDSMDLFALTIYLLWKIRILRAKMHNRIFQWMQIRFI